MGCLRYVEHGEIRNEDKVGFRNIKGLIGRPLHRCEDSIKMGLNAVMCQSELCACSDKHSIFTEAGKFLITWLNTYVLRKALYAVGSCG